VSFDISINGLEDCLARLKRFDLEMQNRFIQDAVTKASEPMLTRVRINAPKRTGAMAASMRMKAYRKKGMFRMCLTRGPKIDYAFPVETGHYIGKIEKDISHLPKMFKDYYTKRIRVKANPFMRRAYIAGKDRIVTDVSRHLKRALDWQR